MRIDVVLRYAGMVLLLNSLFMLASALVSLFNGFDTAFYPLLLSFVITVILGSFPLIFVPPGRHISSKQGYSIVITSWLMSCFVGMLPYLIWGGEFSVTNALFESTSGFTATGATILNDIEALPKGLLFWRFCTIWIGGVGVILFALIALPTAGQSKMTLSSVELSPLAKDSFTHNTKQIVKIIVYVYLVLTSLQIIMLKIAGMEWFDSVCHSFSAIATGGFSTKNTSIMFYDNFWIELVLMIFMTVGGIHFGLIYATIKGKKNNIFSSEVIRIYLLVLLVSGIAVTANLYFSGTYDDILSSLRHGFFQVVSYSTSSGFASADKAAWPAFSTLIMIYLGIQCATAGSTTGGVKIDRVILFIKAIKARILKLQHPNAVIRIKLNGRTQEDSVVSAAVLLIIFLLFSVFISTLIVSMYGYDLLTSFSSSIAAVSNVGAVFSENMGNMSFFPDSLKIWFSTMMLFGRLELFGLIHLFLIRSWK